METPISILEEIPDKPIKVQTQLLWVSMLVILTREHMRQQLDTTPGKQIKVHMLLRLVIKLVNLHKMVLLLVIKLGKQHKVIQQLLLVIMLVLLHK